MRLIIPIQVRMYVGVSGIRTKVFGNNVGVLFNISICINIGENYTIFMFVCFNIQLLL